MISMTGRCSSGNFCEALQKVSRVIVLFGSFYISMHPYFLWESQEREGLLVTIRASSSLILSSLILFQGHRKPRKQRGWINRVSRLSQTEWWWQNTRLLAS